MISRLAFALALLAALSGCGNDNTSVDTQTPVPVPPLALRERFLVAANFEGRALDVFQVERATGALLPRSVLPLDTSVFSLAHGAGQPFIYAAGATSNQVLGFRLASSGTLTPLPGLPLASLGDGTLVLAPSGRFLYHAGDTTIDGFGVNPNDGSLTRLTGFPLAVPGMSDAAESTFDPEGRFLFVAANGSRAVFTLAHDPVTGALTPSGQTPTLAGALGIRFDPGGRFLYVSEADGTLQGFNFSGNGVLAPLSGFPVRYAPPGGFTVRFDFQDNTLFIGDRTTQTLNAFAIGTGGQLTGVPGYPRSGGGGEVVSSAPFLYAGDRQASQINGYRVGTGASTTPLPGSPFRTAGGTTELLPVELSSD